MDRNQKCILVIFLFLLVIVSIYKRTEYFECTGCDSLNIKTSDNNCNYHRIVYGTNGSPNENFEYDKTKYGPKCLNTCILEHVPKINFNDSHKENDILKWNRDNPSMNFCYAYNTPSEGFNKCDGDCIDKCSSDNHCKVSDNNICVEKSLNLLSGGSILTSTKCSENSDDKLGCVNKYMDNINTINNIYYGYMNQIK